MTSLLHRDCRQTSLKVQGYNIRKIQQKEFKKHDYEFFKQYNDTWQGRMARIDIIIKAWANVIKGLTDEEHIRRSKVCGKCPHAKRKKYLELIKNDLEEVHGMVCDLCGCPLVAKIRSEDICEKWEQPMN